MSQQRISALVVDDEQVLRRALVISLMASGFRVSEARNGEEAISAVRSYAPDVVLLDIEMPVMDGLEACRRIRKIVSGVGILMITVRDSEADKVQALESGADEFITKPFILRELVARLRAVYRRLKCAGLTDEAILRSGPFELDLEARTLHKAGVEIRLSPIEFDLLAPC